MKKTIIAYMYIELWKRGDNENELIIYFDNVDEYFNCYVFINGNKLDITQLYYLEQELAFNNYKLSKKAYKFFVKFFNSNKDFTEFKGDRIKGYFTLDKSDDLIIFNELYNYVCNHQALLNTNYRLSFNTIYNCYTGKALTTTFIKKHIKTLKEIKFFIDEQRLKDKIAKLELERFN